MKNPIILKPGKEKIFAVRHHWIFSGAISSYPEGYLAGDIAPVVSSKNQLLGYAFFNPASSLAGRIVSFGTQDAHTYLRKQLESALELRKSFSPSSGFRLINGEGDGFPGLIVDKYGPYLVLQIGSLGMRALLPWILEELEKRLSLRGIYEKSTSSSLKEEKLAPKEEVLWGEVPDTVEIEEAGSLFHVQIKTGQKTGFFLDQREMRSWMGGLASGKRVLNAFCYTGGFTIAALKGGATHVDSVDISSAAIEQCKLHTALNGYSEKNTHFYAQDVFDFLEQNPCAYDLAILDPPAFAKKKKDIPSAIKGYRRLFKLAFQKLPSGCQLLLSSCSYYIDDSLFETIVREAALEAKRGARILGRHRHAIDHPINLHHPESSYLKSLFLSLD